MTTTAISKTLLSIHGRIRVLELFAADQPETTSTLLCEHETALHVLEHWQDLDKQCRWLSFGEKSVIASWVDEGNRLHEHELSILPAQSPSGLGVILEDLTALPQIETQTNPHPHANRTSAP